MIQARFHASLYAKAALVEAVEAFATHATLELVQEGEYWVVNIGSAEGQERLIRAELSNFALGLTAEQRGSG